MLSHQYQTHTCDEVMKPAHIFRDQVNVVHGWFSNWNDIEQTIACYYLLRRLGPTQARFLSLVLEHTFRDSASDVWVLEQEANNKDFLMSLYNENKDFAVQSLLMHLPLLHPGNIEAKEEYLRLLQKILSHSLEKSIHEEECRQLFSLAVVHPAFTKQEKQQKLKFWLGLLAEKEDKMKEKHHSLVVHHTLSDSPAHYIKTDALRGIPSGDLPVREAQANGWRNQSMTINHQQQQQQLQKKEPSQQTRKRLDHKDSGISTSFDEIGSGGLGDALLLDSYDEGGPPPRRVTRSSSFPVDPKILHRKVSPQQSLDSGDEIKIRKPMSPDESSSSHIGMKDVFVWLKSLRLHKYSRIFSELTYDEMMGLTEDFLKSKGVTQGATNKILVCIQKLKERYQILSRLEKEVLQMGKLHGVLMELKNIVITPFKKYIPSTPLSQSETAPIMPTEGGIGSVGVIGDPPDPDDLPAQIVRVMGKANTQIQVTQRDEDYCTTFLWIVEKVLSNEAFTSAQKHKIQSWKAQCQMLVKQLAANRKVAFTDKNSKNCLMDPLGSKRRGVRGGSLKGTSSTGFGLARAIPLAGCHRRLGPSASMSFNSTMKAHPSVCRTKSAPIQQSRIIQPSNSDDGLNKSFENLETLCRSMTEHALEDSTDGKQPEDF